MEIGVIGGGSIGLLVSSYLTENHNVTLYVRRKAQQEKIKKEQIQLLKGSKTKKKLRISVDLINELQNKDCFIVCVKQIHIPNVIAHLKKCAHNIPIIFLQNGMGHIASIKQLRQPSYIGIVEHGAHRIKDNSVNHLGEGVIKLASISGNEEQLHYLIQELDEKTFPFLQIDDWHGLLKSKLIINAVINPLTALFDVPNGSIFKNEHIQCLAKKLCAETASVLALDLEKAWDTVVETAKNTSENVSSMRADIKQNRPTEIDAITGYILSVNKGVKTLPYSTFVYHAILSLEQERDV